jgi:hypothetical protein
MAIDQVIEVTGRAVIGAALLLSGPRVGCRKAPGSANACRVTITHYYFTSQPFEQEAG